MWDVIASAISMRSFSTLWYWIAVAAFWAWATRQVMGVPHDVVARARRGADQMQQLEIWAQMQARRLAYFWQRGQIFIVAIAGSTLGLTTVLAFGYGMELAQALWFVLAPMVVISAMSVRLAIRVLGEDGHGNALLRVMFRFRIYTQVLSFVFIFANVIFAFFQMLTQGLLG